MSESLKINPQALGVAIQTVLRGQKSPFVTLRYMNSRGALSARTLERWRVEGIGPEYRKFGRRVVYSRNDLEKWAATRCFQSTSQES